MLRQQATVSSAAQQLVCHQCMLCDLLGSRQQNMSYALQSLKAVERHFVHDDQQGHCTFAL